MVRASTNDNPSLPSDDPLQYLESDDENGVYQRSVRVQDKGSRNPKALVDIQGVPAEGVIDTGADITIVGAELFKKIATVAHLKKSQFKPPDKTPYSYDRKPFNLHGKLELDITFEGQTMLTPVYVKMDAQDSLLLSEGVCRQLGIVSYHSQVQQKRTVSNSSNGNIAAREEVANQLRKMQSQGIIQPSTSSRASPVVLVRKKDGSLRFCIDYRALNSVTKTDQFPLPRIDDLLDQLGRAKYFTTLDLAAGYWQVEMHPDSKEKTAFATYQGLYEFNVMPFGLKNAPGVFQRLMQRVLMGLNPENGPDFVATYLDNVLIFSTTFEEHLVHLRSVLDRLLEVGLKLKPAKCHFICQSVEYLGHLVTPQGISPNPARVAAVKDYPTPTSVKEMRQFVGIASYYRRFIKGFAKVAQPLHALTQKGAVFKWSVSCQEAFQHLKNLLVEAPVLAYPDFLKPFTLETDASVLGLGAVLSQQQDDGHLHPVAYASRALSPQEKRYGITELETLAVVWSMQHYHAYLYGHEVTVFTDHSAVKAVLETPSPSGKHARWWNKVFGSGVKKLDIVYRAGRENDNADALSRAPCGQSPEEPVVTDSQVMVVTSASANADIHDLLKLGAVTRGNDSFVDEQQKDSEILEMILYLTKDDLPDCDKTARKIVAKAPCFTVIVESCTSLIQREVEGKDVLFHTICARA